MEHIFRNEGYSEHGGITDRIQNELPQESEWAAVVLDFGLYFGLFVQEFVEIIFTGILPKHEFDQ